MPQNTFWTQIDNQYFRIYNGQLFNAPSFNNDIDTNNQSVVKSIDSAQLDKINIALGTNLELSNL